MTADKLESVNKIIAELNNINARTVASEAVIEAEQKRLAVLAFRYRELRGELHALTDGGIDTPTRSIMMAW